MPHIENIVSPQANGGSGNPALNFVLAGYLNPRALPGAVPKTAEALAAMDAMRRRAKFEAMLCGAAQSDAADEGLSQSLAELGRSSLAETYRPTPRGVRPYVNCVIRRKVNTAAAAWRSARTVAVPETQDKADGPARVAEVNEIRRLCNDRLGKVKPPPARPGQSQTASATHMRTRHMKVRRWKAICSLFPNMPLRPPSPKAGFKVK